MTRMNVILHQIWIQEQKIDRTKEKIKEQQKTLDALKLELADLIRQENEPMLAGIPEESAAILRKAADFGLLIRAEMG